MVKKGERDRFESIGLSELLGKGVRKKDDSIAFAKRAGRIACDFHPIQ